jgi:outer membrane biosynthesis protein TonB
MKWMWMLAPLCAAACGGGATKNEAAEPVAAEAVTPGDTTPILDDDGDDGQSSDGITIANERGTLDEADINRVVERHSSALQGCYAANAATTPYVGGRVELAFKVGTDGVVKTVRVGSGDLGSWPVEKCVLEKARAMTFPKPRGRGDAEFTFAIDFPARTKVTALDETRAQTELAPKLAELADCGDAGRVQVTVYVGIKGAVTSAGFAAAAQPLPEEWADCALARAITWKLTDPRGTVVKASSWTRP